jgi:glycogen debranching enzyme
MPIAFDRSICRDLNETISREWLITNGQGAYASGTVAGVLTRMQHGLLVAPVPGASVPQLLLAKIDEEIVFDQRTYYLATNEYQDGTLNPSGFVHLESFRLEEGFPIFTFRLGGIDGILLEKRIWMPRGSNTTFIQYRVLRRAGIAEETATPETGSWNNSWEPRSKTFGRYHSYSDAAQRVLSLTLLPFSAYRPYDQPQYGNLDWHFQVQVHHNEETNPGDIALPRGVTGCTIRALEDAAPYSILVVGHANSHATFIPTNVWYWHFLRRHDQAAGRAPVDDLYLPGVIRAKLWPGEDSTLTIIVSAEELSSSSQVLSPAQCNHSYRRCVEEQHTILQPQRYFGEGGVTSQYDQMLPLPIDSAFNDTSCNIGAEEFLRLLVQAADRFLVQRKVSPLAGAGTPAIGRGPFFFTEPERISAVLASYYALEDSTRDTLIALPGLTLSTRRFDVARNILRNLARYFRQGLLPDHLPLTGQTLAEQDYSSADTALWYFYALDLYLRATHDYELLDELYTRLVDSIDWHLKGTYNSVGMDTDGLLQASQPGKALTWMNTTINSIPITPRSGKPVEVNALWYHALSLMQEWSQHQQEQGRTSTTPAYYAELSRQCKESFDRRFWYAFGDYLYDGIDGPGGEDATLRPNQLLALSLRYPVLDMEHWQAVLNTVTQHLVTPRGLRTLAPREAEYQGQPTAQQEEQSRALHQGSSWPWLIGPYVDALLNIERAFPTVRQAENRNQTQGDWWHKSLQLLEPFRMLLQEGMLGMVGGVYDGNAPQHIGTRVTSAISIGEILRVHNLLAQYAIQHTDALLTAQSTSKGHSSYGMYSFHEYEKRSF